MPLSLRRKESVRAAFERVARKRIDRIRELLEHEPCTSAEERIHQARKQLKQLRTLLRLLRRGADENITSAPTSSCVPYPGLCHCYAISRHFSRRSEEFQERGAITSESFATERPSLETRWQRTRAYILATAKHRQHLSETLRKARREITHGFSIHRGWKAIGPGLRQIYSAGQAAIEALSFDDSDEAIHEARKRTKDVQHAARALCNGPELAQYGRQLTPHVTLPTCWGPTMIS